MHQITSVSGESDRKLLQTNKNSKPREATGNNCAKPGYCGKPGYLQKQCKKNSLFCIYCKTPGHLRADCFKLKKREQTTTSAQSTPVAAVSTAEITPKDEETIAIVQHDNDRNFMIPDALAKISMLNMKNCLFALVDTSSPISFVKQNVYKMFLDSADLLIILSPSAFSYSKH